MAIAFASAKFIQRRRGHSPIERLAYISRARIIEQRTGAVHDYTSRLDLIGGPKTLLPAGAPDTCRDAEQLWTLVDGARHKFAALGLDLIVALPPAHELKLCQTLELLEDFLADAIVSHGLAATYAVHAPHRTADDSDMAEDAFLSSSDPFAEAMRQGLLNYHAHVLITPRRLGPAGFGRRYKALEPTLKRGQVVDALAWGRLWASYQNQWFYDHELKLRVRPSPPLSAETQPLRQVRRRRAGQLARPVADGRELIVHRRLEAANQYILQTNSALTRLLRPFTIAELRMLLERYLPTDLASEIIEAKIGLGEILEIEGCQPGPRWFVTAAVAVAELSVVGRAAVLAAQGPTVPPSEPALGGLSRHAARVCAQIETGPNLVVIESQGSPDTILEDLSRNAEKMGRMAVSIGHGAGSSHPKSTVISIATLGERKVSNAIVLLDQADALTAIDLDLVLQAALTGRSQLVLVRRSQSPWPRWALLDVIANATLRIDWKPEALWSNGSTGAAPPSGLTGLDRAAKTQPPPPTAGITRGLVGWSLANDDGEVRFAVDAHGEVVTGSRIAEAVTFWATAPFSGLSWAGGTILSDREVRDALGSLHPGLGIEAERDLEPWPLEAEVDSDITVPSQSEEADFEFEGGDTFQMFIDADNDDIIDFEADEPSINDQEWDSEY